MKQIQNTVPQSQHHARACRPPASQIRRPVRRSGAKSRRASKATRRDEASAEAGGARGRQKSARVRAWRRNRNRFHTLPCGRGQSIGWWWCSRPHVVAACPACLPASLLAQAARAARGEGRKLAAPAAAPWGVWDGEGDGDAAGLPVSTRVAPRYFL